MRSSRVSKRVYTLVIAVMVGVIGVITFQNNVEAMTNKDLAGKAYLINRHNEGDNDRAIYLLFNNSGTKCFESVVDIMPDGTLKAVLHRKETTKAINGQKGFSEYVYKVKEKDDPGYYIKHSGKKDKMYLAEYETWGKITGDTNKFTVTPSDSSLEPKTFELSPVQPKPTKFKW